MTDNQLRLRIPIACKLGNTCEIQNYVDHDAGPGAEEYTGGGRTYDQHNGTDFRLPSLTSLRNGVAVVAAAGGRVTAVRESVEDVSVKERGRAAVAGVECGNGVVIDHGNGWQTQYCHMAKGSIKVQPGDKVLVGQPIGAVGMSGLSEYPHLHFTVRSHGQVVDPFAHSPTGSVPTQSLWAAAAQPAMGYRTRIILNQGFASRPITNDMIEAGTLEHEPPTRESPMLVAYVRLIGVREGDLATLMVHSPEGRVIAENAGAPLERGKAQLIIFAGRKAPIGGWPEGSYEATCSVTNNGRLVQEHRFRHRIGSRPD